MQPWRSERRKRKRKEEVEGAGGRQVFLPFLGHF
jgi:hypothetical protein